MKELRTLTPAIALDIFFGKGQPINSDYYYNDQVNLVDFSTFTDLIEKVKVENSEKYIAYIPEFAETKGYSTNMDLVIENLFKVDDVDEFIINKGITSALVIYANETDTLSVYSKNNDIIPLLPSFIVNQGEINTNEVVTSLVYLINDLE